MGEMQESAQMRISSILSSGLEGEAKTNKDYFKDLADIISLSKDAELTDEQIEQIAANYEEIISDELNHHNVSLKWWQWSVALLRTKIRRWIW